MKRFHCQHCGQPVYFENVRCLRCDSTLAYVPERGAMLALEPQPGRPGHWHARSSQGGTLVATWRHCRNRRLGACNFAVPTEDPNRYCVSCRQTRTRPDLHLPGQLTLWRRAEAAKRRLYYALALLGLVQPLRPDGTRDGPIYDLLAEHPGQPVLTGHAQGVVTLNIAEADDTERVRRRIALNEPYRTLLGHLRHESGHCYWDSLVRDPGQLEAFRRLFGDERTDYGQALTAHYGRAQPPTDWADQFVSAYATAHPWEDWAETWAHCLHMLDLLETAASYGLRLDGEGEAHGETVALDDPYARPPDFDRRAEQWTPLTLLLNSLNRSLGQDDAYPFALSAVALQKLRFVHDRVMSVRPGPPKVRPAPA